MNDRAAQDAGVAAGNGAGMRPALSGPAAAAAATDAPVAVTPSGDPTGVQDSNQIAAAIASAQGAGGIVELAEGLFVVNRSIRPVSKLWIRGRGIERTVVTLANGVAHGNTLDNVFFCTPTTAEDLYAFRLSDMTVDGNRSGLDVTEHGHALGSIAPALPYAVGAANDTLTYSVNGGGARTARLAAGTYQTLFTLVGALQAALNTAGTGTTAFALGRSVGIKSDSGTPPSTITGLGGNGLAGLMGVPVSHAGVGDNGGNGICIRGSGAFLCRDFLVERLECRNAPFHGMAIYDGACNYEVHGCRFHDNGYRGFHCHASDAAGGPPSSRFNVSGNWVFHNGQGLFNVGNSGLFVVFMNTHDVSVTGNTVWDEPALGLELDGSSSTAAQQPTDNSVVSGNRVINCGTGAFITALSPFGPTGLVLAHNIFRGCGINMLLGSAPPSTLTITAAANNNRLSVTLGAATRTVTVPDGAPYASHAALAAAVQAAINTAFATDPAAVTVSALAKPANVFYLRPSFANGGGAARFAVGAVAGNNGFAVLFGTAPLQYGGRAANASGHGIVLSGGSSGGSDMVISGNRINGCSAWGIASTAAPAGWRNITIAHNVITNNGLDQSTNSGGMLIGAGFSNGTIVGNICVGNNALSATGRQASIAGTAMAVIGNVFDTGPGSPGNFVALDLGTTASVCMGNVLNRGAGAGAQGRSTGGGNVVADNTLGSAGTGSFQFIATTDLAAAAGFAQAGTAAASLSGNAPGSAPVSVVEWEVVKRANGAVGYRPIFG